MTSQGLKGFLHPGPQCLVSATPILSWRCRIKWDQLNTVWGTESTQNCLKTEQIKHKSNTKNTKRLFCRLPGVCWYRKAGQLIPPHPGILASMSLQCPGFNAELDNGSLLPATRPGGLMVLYSNKSPTAPVTAATHCFFKGLNKTCLILLAWNPAAAGQVLWSV